MRVSPSASPVKIASVASFTISVYELGRYVDRPDRRSSKLLIVVPFSVLRFLFVVVFSLPCPVSSSSFSSSFSSPCCRPALSFFCVARRGSRRLRQTWAPISWMAMSNVITWRTARSRCMKEGRAVVARRDPWPYIRWMWVRMLFSPTRHVCIAVDSMCL